MDVIQNPTPNQATVEQKYTFLEDLVCVFLLHVYPCLKEVGIIPDSRDVERLAQEFERLTSGDEHERLVQFSTPKLLELKRSYFCYNKEQNFTLKALWSHERENVYLLYFGQVGNKHLYAICLKDHVWSLMVYHTTSMPFKFYEQVRDPRLLRKHFLPVDFAC